VHSEQISGVETTDQSIFVTFLHILPIKATRSWPVDGTAKIVEVFKKQFHLIGGNLIFSKPLNEGLFNIKLPYC